MADSHLFVMVDLKISNLQSVREAFRRVGAEVTMANGPQDIESAEAVILPGVGAFGDGMESLSDQGLIGPLRAHALEKKKPLIGICLGMQLLAGRSEEFGLHEGLGLIGGQVVRLEATGPGLRVPNMGWCDVAIQNPNSQLFAGFRRQPDPIFYFAHSYHLECADGEDMAGALDFGQPITAAIERDNLFGLQFHPEKSQGAGLEVLSAFCRYAAASQRA
jgi:glutamine amidotransferase